MKDKIISYGSCVSIFQPNLQRSFGTIPPLEVITGPANAVLYSWSGSISLTSKPNVALGTIERWRPDPSDPMPLNRDQWVLWSTGTADMVKVKEAEKSTIPNHWSGSLPTDVQNNSPKWVGTFISEMINKTT